MQTLHVPLANSLPWSLWSFVSPVWNGYIDFRGDGVYYTHWGLGRYVVNGNVVTMRNDYDTFTHRFVFPFDGTYSGERSDGVSVSGTHLATYHGDYRDT